MASRPADDSWSVTSEAGSTLDPSGEPTYYTADLECRVGFGVTHAGPGSDLRAMHGP